MRLEHIIERLERDYPPSLAEAWDNPGLQVGRRERNVQKIYVALDATDAVVEHAIEHQADLLLTHHPLLIGGIRQINSDGFQGKKILNMIENQLSHYAMHTNYDVVRMGDLCSEYLKLQKVEVLEVSGEWDSLAGPVATPHQGKLGIGSVGNLPEEMTLQECCAYVKQAFSLEQLKIFGNLEKKVQRVAMCPGSGKSMIPAALKKKAQVYITGDIGHHDGLDALEQGMAIIDAGHYGLEHVFLFQMESYLKEQFPELEIQSETVRFPFQVL